MLIPFILFLTQIILCYYCIRPDRSNEEEVLISAVKECKNLGIGLPNLGITPEEAAKRIIEFQKAISKL